MIDEENVRHRDRRSKSSQDVVTSNSNCAGNVLPLPPRPWITDVSSDDSEPLQNEDVGSYGVDRPRVRSRHRPKYKTMNTIPIGFFWDIENCQVPRGCSAVDVVSAIRAKFLTGRREADFVVVCDVRKEASYRLQELNDSQVSLIHVCGTQKNAADDKLRQCMRRFGELHSAPAALVLISGDINFAGDLSDFRYRKNMEVILVHKQHTSSALIACATSHYNYNDITSSLPRTNKNNSQSDPEEEPTCELEVCNLPLNINLERVSKRLRRLADNCGGKVFKVTPPTALLRFPTPDHTSRALKRMNGEDVFGWRISTRNVRSVYAAPTYSSDEGYVTAPTVTHAPSFQTVTSQTQPPAMQQGLNTSNEAAQLAANKREWAMALQQLPNPVILPNQQSRAATPMQPPHPTALPTPHQQMATPQLPPGIKPRKIRGTHGSNLIQQAENTFAGAEDPRTGFRDSVPSRSASPWNSSASFSEHSSDGDNETTELTVTNLPSTNVTTLQNMLTQLLSQHVQVLSVTVWGSGDGAIASVLLKSESDARLLISRIHKRRLDNQWAGRRLELSLGRPSPAVNLDVLRARLRAILLAQPGHSLPLLRLRDAYASRHCSALTTSDIAKVRDTVVVHENFGRVVQLVDPTPSRVDAIEETMWRCNIHGMMNMGQDDAVRILSPVYIELSELCKRTELLLVNHGGMLPLLSYVDCYESMFPPLAVDTEQGVSLELLLRSIPNFTIKDAPLRHIAWSMERNDTPSPVNQNEVTQLDPTSAAAGLQPVLFKMDNWQKVDIPVSLVTLQGEEANRDRIRPRTAPSLQPLLSLFEKEIVDILKTAPRSAIQFSKLIPAFHHHFGRQCRVADYGFTKLPDLLSALSNTILILGSGSSRVITLSATAQARRWTTDLVKLLKLQMRAVYIEEIPGLYQAHFSKPFVPADYGVCTLPELMHKISPQTIVLNNDGTIALPKRVPTDEERMRTVQFAMESIELLCSTPNLRLEFPRFVPAYHAHFGRQLRVAHYGCVKLQDLLELIPDSVTVKPSGRGGDKVVHLSLRPARTILSDRFTAICPVSLGAFPAAYANRFGAPPLPDMMEMNSVEALIFAVGGYIENMIVRAAGDRPRWVTAALTACAVLSSDRSVAKGSTEEFFINSFKDRFGQLPNLQHLESSGVIIHSDGRIMLSNVWRLVWRVALLLSAHSLPLTYSEIITEYSKRYEPVLPFSEIGFDSLKDFVCYFRDVFAEDEHHRFSVCGGVAVPQSHVARTLEDLSALDTPPGQKGSRVFESPQNSIWSSPPASALPAPTALLAPDNKRRTRLAVQFNAS